MQLFSPHINAALRVTGFSILGAYLVLCFQLLFYETWNYYPLLWLIPGIFWILGISCVSWVACVRWIEYKRMCDRLQPLVSGYVLQDTFIQTLDWLLQINVQSIDFFLRKIQSTSSTSGSYRALIAALAKSLDISWQEAEVLLKKNHVNCRKGTSWRDYLLPGW